MSAVIVTADIVGSTELKSRYDQATAAKKIRAALESFKNDLCRVDELLHCPVPYAGDNILLLGGTNPTEIYHAAVEHQGMFRSWEYGRMPIKVSLGFGNYETVQNESGHTSYHGSDLDLLHRICDFCPPGGIVVTQAMHSILEDAGYGRRFHECRETLKGLGPTVFYESNGDYVAPPKARQFHKDRGGWRQWRRNFLPHGPVERAAALTAGGLLIAVVLHHVLNWTR